jgi:hypothetical protein
MEKKKKLLSNLINNLKNKTMETNEIELIVNELDNDFTEVLTQMEAEDDNK